MTLQRGNSWQSFVLHNFKASVSKFDRRVLNLNFRSPLRQAVVLRQELLPLMLPKLGRGHVQVYMLPAAEELVTSEV